MSVVELRDNMADLREVLGYLGPSWDVVFSDYISDAGGNHERIGYVFDRRAVTFTGLASNAEAPRKKVGEEYLPKIDWWRPPFIASFRAGSFEFILIAAHICWSKGEEDNRLREIQLLADWVKRRAGEKYLGDKDILVVGDFNIPDTTSALYRAIVSRGLVVPKALLGKHGTSLAEDKRYDQILSLPMLKRGPALGGICDFYKGDFKPLFQGRMLDKEACTYELSDHLPLWIQIPAVGGG